MGVPALFRWLSNKYPKIISPVIEEQPYEFNGETIPVDTTKPNPNGEENDNLYLDMNGIVHPCTHPEGKPAPANEQEMMLEIFRYTDRVVNMVRPRKLLMIAVDGVAPRAKMNQQRSRRFRSAQEARENDQKKEEFQKLLARQNAAKGINSDSDIKEQVIQKTWDSNVITPGTPFMDILAASLRYWIAYKLNTDPAWEKLKIIISDATVPGEGEHKVMNFIRSQRQDPSHNPNTHHVLYGLDADLIMLGLATHEPHFRVLREDVFFQESKPRTCQLCGQPGHKAEECRGQAKEKNGDFDEKQKAVAQKPFIWLNVSVLREYLAVELQVTQQRFPFDLERALDDWVFMCFFVGNDFLPHLPSLDIKENAIDLLISIWRECIPLMDDYVTKDGIVNFKNAQLILAGLAKQEGAIFKRRKQAEDRKAANERRRKEEEKTRNEERSQKRRRSSPGYAAGDPIASTTPNKARKQKDGFIASTEVALITPSRGHLDKETRQLTHSMVVNRTAVYKANAANKSAAAALKSQLMKGTLGARDENRSSNGSGSGEEGAALDDSQEPSPSVLGKRKVEELDDAESGTPGRDSPVAAAPAKPTDELPPDTVRLWEDGYTERYYEQKFHVEPSDMEFRHKVARSYAEGLQWVLLYYMQGCPSWTWYYPYHYAPFAADFVDIENLELKFEKGKPFRPFEQLMGVLPASSNHAIPEIFHDLMSDPNSEIIDFYPEDFPVDLNGKKFAWQGVVLLPFIDENRLLAAMEKKYPHLSPDEQARNTVGRDVLLISDQHPLYQELVGNFYSKKQGAPKFTLNMRTSEGLAGKIEKDDNYIPHSSLSPPCDVDMPTLDEDKSMMVNYEIPKSVHLHKSMLLRGVRFSPPALDQGDINTVKSRWRYGMRPFSGGSRPGRGGGQYNQQQGAGAGRPNMNDRQNPFAAHLDPSFVPPPQVGGARGWAPPPVGGAGYSYGPPPPPRGGNYEYPPPSQGYNSAGYYGQGNGYFQGQNQYGYPAQPTQYGQQNFHNGPEGGGGGPRHGDSRGYNNDRGGNQSYNRGGYSSRRDYGYDRY
ncbi:5'-3' exoribonuclease 2 [Talaromyces atroroseus]|uniref:5'-3' exoribonuclease n=1 Tax=Talaromyces atroroseus TaxID=1441469 RepID=A0A225AXF9_TALAT|nr:5'-3' exoribonuclease 2 [Talaromyces atroroseus]OKL64303.1 5'-3' exoribonuclease 2 [Talaromyces atroroseus]